MIELHTEEPQRNRINTWRLYWFHQTDPDANYPADKETLAKAGYVPTNRRVTMHVAFARPKIAVAYMRTRPPDWCDWDSLSENEKACYERFVRELETTERGAKVEDSSALGQVRGELAEARAEPSRYQAPSRDADRPDLEALAAARKRLSYGSDTNADAKLVFAALDYFQTELAREYAARGEEIRGGEAALVEAKAALERVTEIIGKEHAHAVRVAARAEAAERLAEERGAEVARLGAERNAAVFLGKFMASWFLNDHHNENLARRFPPVAQCARDLRAMSDTLASPSAATEPNPPEPYHCAKCGASPCEPCDRGVDHGEAKPAEPELAIEHVINGHIFQGTLESVDSFGNCDSCGLQFGARFTRECHVANSVRTMAAVVAAIGPGAVPPKPALPHIRTSPFQQVAEASATLGKDHGYVGPDGAKWTVRGGSLDDFKRAAMASCWCHRCNPDQTTFPTRMILCPTCGNKRCPKASDHELACTGSNATGQPVSAYPSVDAATKDSSPQGQKEERDNERNSTRGLRRLRGLHGMEELRGQSDAEMARAAGEDSGCLESGGSRGDADVSTTAEEAAVEVETTKLSKPACPHTSITDAWGWITCRDCGASLTLEPYTKRVELVAALRGAARRDALQGLANQLLDSVADELERGGK